MEKYNNSHSCVIYTLDIYTQNGYSMNRIKSFKNSESQKIYNGLQSAKFPAEMQTTALRKLIMLDNAASIKDLMIPPGNKLEALSGDRKGQFSIRINDKYRICFKVIDNMFCDVEIVDYH